MAEITKDWASLDDLVLLNVSKYLLWPDRVRAAQVCGNWYSSFLPAKPDTIVRASFEDGCPKKAGSDEAPHQKKFDEACSASNSAKGNIASRIQQLIINVCSRQIKYGMEAESYIRKLMGFKDLRLQVFSLRFCSCSCDYDRYYELCGVELEITIYELISKNGSLEVINLAAPIVVKQLENVATLPKLTILRLRTYEGGWGELEPDTRSLSKLTNLQELQFHLESLRDVLGLIGLGKLTSRSPIHLFVVCSNDPYRWRRPESHDWRSVVRRMKHLTVSFIFEEACSEKTVHTCLDEQCVPAVGIKLFLNKPLNQRRVEGEKSISLAESVQLHAPTLKYFSFAGPRGAVCDESMTSLLSNCTQLQKVTIYGSVKQETLDQWRQRYSQCTFTVLAHDDVYKISKPPTSPHDSDYDYEDYSSDEFAW